MTFVIYDLTFLVLFVILVSVFLYTRKSNLKKEGLLYLYRTRLGMKLIDYVGGKYKKTLKALSYVSIATGYALMISMFYLTYSILKIYILRPDVVSAIKVPPITPLVPYIDKIVPGLPSFFFTYWIIIIAIIAITHEFSHGIFMKRYGIKIKSTGFGFFPFFLPVFLAAFVEQDDESMTKKKNFEQMAVLSAGTFANVLTAILFFGILILFFSLAFTPSGVVFDSYQYSYINSLDIISINNILVSNATHQQILDLSNEEGFTEVRTKDELYFSTMELINNSANKEIFEAYNTLVLFDDSPAINAGLTGAILKVNGVSINSVDELQKEFMKFSVGEIIEIETTEGIYEITLEENPEKKGSPYLGIGFMDQGRTGVIGKVVDSLSPKTSHVNYEPNFGMSEFIYKLIWWIVLISLSVALVNMLPVGIFDGGRFFYLTILSITKNKKIAENFFKVSTYFFLFLLLILMVFWVISFI